MRTYAPDLIGLAVSNGCIRVRNDLLRKLFDQTLAGTSVTRPSLTGYDRAMARTRTPKQNDILSRVTELGHEALNRLSEVPGGSKVVDMMNDSKTRLDEMQKKLRGLDALEKRVAKLEKLLAATEKKPAATTRRRTATARPPAAPKTPPAE